MFPNFYPISFDFDSYQVQRIPYNKNLLNDLRAKYSKTHSFFRHDDYIYLCPFEENTELLGELTSASLNDPITGSFIRHILFRAFAHRFSDVKITSFYPFRFKSRNPKHDLIEEGLPHFLKGCISFRKEMEVQIRNIQIKGKLTWGVIINNDYRWEFNIAADALVKEGFDIIGKEVLERNERVLESGTFIEHYRLIGQADRIYNNIAIVNTNKGNKEVPLNKLRLHKSKTTIKSYLDFKMGSEKSKNLFSTIAIKEDSRHDARQNLFEINSTAKVLSDLEYNNADGFSFRINPQIQKNFDQAEQQTPSLVFSYDGYKTSLNADSGLTKFGPYDSLTFDIKRPRVLVICHRHNRGTFTNFLAKFKTGLPHSNYFKEGFLGKYRLHEIDFVVEEISDYSIPTYEEIIRSAIRKSLDSPFSIALIETKNEWKTFSSPKNPYYHIYAYLLSLGIPIQWITQENAKKPDQYLDSILNSIALQIYAKIGGTPWVLPANASIDRELVIGIGSSVIKANNFKDARQEKIIGITTFFSSDGRYMFANKSRDVSYDRYFEELLSNIDSSLQEISKRDGWRFGDTIRIVFHIFKSITNQEAKVVEKLIQQYSQYNIKFAFVTVSDDHPFWLFEPEERGIPVGQAIKGQYVPRRGQTLVLNEHSCLVQMKGAKQLKTVKQGISRPLLINIHRESTFKDLLYISQQIFSFSNLSWRGFFPTQEPVTIYYSDLIADKLAHLREIQGWRSELINGSLKFKKWFL